METARETQVLIFAFETTSWNLTKALMGWKASHKGLLYLLYIPTKKELKLLNGAQHHPSQNATLH